MASSDVSLMVHVDPAPRSAIELLTDSAGRVCGSGGGTGDSGADADGSDGGGVGGDGAARGDVGGGSDGVPEQASCSKLPEVPGHSLYPSLCLVRPITRKVIVDEEGGG